MRKTRSKQIIISLAVVGLLVFFHYINILRPLENGLIIAFKPVSAWFYKIGVNIQGTFHEQSTKQDLIAQIEKLEVKNQELIQENANLKKQEEENEKLRQHLKFFEEYEYNYTLSNVVSKATGVGELQNQKQIIIDKGAKSGIRPGMVVVSERGIVVGKILKAEEYLSTVSLTTSKDCKMAVSIQNQNKTSGITEGELGLTIKMNFIPQTEEINLGDNVVTSGLEENIPRGLVLGQITKLDKDSNEVWQSATIEPLLDYDNLIIVSVLIP
jgi:rod shape-determining protein MreC